MLTRLCAASADAAAVLNANGSALHLTGLDCLIRRIMLDWDATMQAAAEELHSRQPHNAFFEWLAKGSSDSLVDEIVAQCPPNGSHPQEQWSFVREDSKDAWRQSMGWEFLALGDWMLSGI